MGTRIFWHMGRWQWKNQILAWSTEWTQEPWCENVNIFCVDGLTGFREAIRAVYPFAGIQRCIIHQIRSSSKYVSYKHIKEFMSDLKLVYRALNEEAAFEKLLEFKEKWQTQYPLSVKLWKMIGMYYLHSLHILLRIVK